MDKMTEGYKDEKNLLCCRLLFECLFFWGGRWKNIKT